jgi:protein MpaA
VIGRSVEGRPIQAIGIGSGTAIRTVLVVGCIHGSEPAGIAIAQRLQTAPAPPGSALWIVPDLNPDGVAAGTRTNAHLVDLNRNFPWHWRPLGPPGDPQYAGPRPLSEPESGAAARLILRVRPQITIWFHQPAALVDLSGGNPRIERRFAALVGLPVIRLQRYPGSAVNWSNAQLPGTTAFVVELPPGPLSRAAVARYSKAVLVLANPSTTF